MQVMGSGVRRHEIEQQLRRQLPRLDPASIQALADLQQDMERIDTMLAPLCDSPWAVVLQDMPGTGIAQAILHVVSEHRHDPYALRQDLAIELLRVWDSLSDDLQNAAMRAPLGPFLREVLRDGLGHLSRMDYAAATPQLLVAIEGMVRQLAERELGRSLPVKMSFEGVAKRIPSLWMPKRLIWSKWMFEAQGNPFRHGLEPADESVTFVQARLLGFGVALALDDLLGQDTLRRQVAQAIAGV
jgi:hypothetical protein